MDTFEHGEFLPIQVEDTSTELAEIGSISDIEEDYQKTRTNIYDLLEKGKEGLEVALSMVSATESPRSIEVFSTLLRTLADTNLQLLEIQKKHHDMSVATKVIQQENATNINNQTINQTVFAGTTSDLAKLLATMKEKDYEPK
jgi:hypothetical protein